MPDEMTTTRKCGLANHDWRVDPTMMLTSYPPAERLVCADCGQVASRPVKRTQPDPRDVKSWPKA